MRFNGVLCVWDQISVTIFCQKRYFLAREKTECLTKSFSDSHDFCLLFYFSIFLRHYVTYVPAGFGKVLLALILGCHGWIQRGDRGSRPPLFKITKIGFLSNTGPDLLKNHELPSQHSMLGHYRPASVSLAGQ